MSFEIASWVEYKYKIGSLYLLRFKIFSKSWQQTDRQDKNNMPPINNSDFIMMATTDNTHSIILVVQCVADKLIES